MHLERTTGLTRPKGESPAILSQAGVMPTHSAAGKRTCYFKGARLTIANQLFPTQRRAVAWGAKPVIQRGSCQGDRNWRSRAAERHPAPKCNTVISGDCPLRAECCSLYGSTKPAYGASIAFRGSTPRCPVPPFSQPSRVSVRFLGPTLLAEDPYLHSLRHLA